MAIIGNNADTLLNGLSDFWHRFFLDTPDLQAMFEGTEIQLGQFYLELLNDVLNVSLSDTPLFQKQFYKLITVREDQIVFRSGGGVYPDGWVYTAADGYGSIPQLHNKVFNATASLEAGADYSIDNNEITFLTDVTAPPPNGFATRSVDVAVGGFFVSHGLVSDWVAADVKKGDRLLTSAVDNTLTNLTYRFKVVHVAGDRLALAPETPAPVYPDNAIPAGHAWRIERDTPVSTVTVASSGTEFDGDFNQLTSLRLSEVSLWAVDALVDTQALYQNFGHLFSGPRASSETYRAFVRGLMQLYILGPAIERMESALNVVADLPVVRDDGEVLQGYLDGVDATGTGGALTNTGVFSDASALFVPDDLGGKVTILDGDYGANIGTHTITAVLSTTQVQLRNERNDLFVNATDMTWRFSRSGVQTIKTNAQTYIYPLGVPIRDDVKDSGNVGTLTFRSFEPLTTAITVTDYISDPEWWHNITLPQSILPDTPLADRGVTPQLYPNTIGPLGNFRIGDPGFYIGANEDGVVSTTPYRHQANFILMDRFLKMHLFSVSIDPSVELNDVRVNDLEQLVRNVKPSHTQVYLAPQTVFQELVTLADELFSGARLPLSNPFAPVDNSLRIGGIWTIGQTWAFADASGGSITAGGNTVFIGGLDPNIVEAELSDSATYFERPLSVTTRAA